MRLSRRSPNLPDLARVAAMAMAMTLIPALSQAEPLEIAGVNVARDITCRAGDKLEIRGVDHELTIRGRCDAIQLSGANHRIVFEAAGVVEIAGSEHTITGGALSLLSLSGIGTLVTSGVRAGPDSGADPTRAVVGIAGSRQRVELALESATSITISGVRNTVEWTTVPGVSDPALKIVGSEHSARRKR